jgi:hypothetical protein
MEHAPSPAPIGAPASAEPAPDWPPWFGFVGFVAAVVATAVAVGLILIFAGVDSDEDSSVVVIVATLAQSVFFVGAVLVLARSVARPRAWHFGLRRAPLWKTVGWAAVGMLTFYVATGIYSVLVDPSVEQDVTERLGADEGTAGLIAAGVMVMVVAPFVEELFFRGFFYRALRTRYPIVVAALVDGLVFGLIHFDFAGSDGLLLLPPLAFLGMIFCFVYERTGTLWSVVGMHAFNNAVAFSAQAGDFDGWQVAVVVGPLMLVACAAIPRLMRHGPPPLPPRRSQPDAQLSLPIR